MTPDFVSEYAPLNGMVKACQRFIMALADVIFDATTRAPSVYAIFVSSCLYHMFGSKRPIPLCAWGMTDLVCMGRRELGGSRNNSDKTLLRMVCPALATI